MEIAHLFSDVSDAVTIKYTGPSVCPFYFFELRKDGKVNMEKLGHWLWESRPDSPAFLVWSCRLLGLVRNPWT